MFSQPSKLRNRQKISILANFHSNPNEQYIDDRDNLARLARRRSDELLLDLA
jgi:hypothetical protein